MPREQTSQCQTMMMKKRKQKQQQMEMMTPATNRLLMKEGRPEVHQHHHQLVLSELNPAPHLLPRNHRHPCGTRDSLMEDPVLPPDQKNTPLAPLGIQMKKKKRKKKTKKKTRRCKHKLRRGRGSWQRSGGFHPRPSPTPFLGSQSRSDQQPFLPTSLSTQGRRITRPVRQKNNKMQKKR